jgi:hypothetical protein
MEAIELIHWMQRFVESFDPSSSGMYDSHTTIVTSNNRPAPFSTPATTKLEAAITVVRHY